ncbi:MAG: hypothetical protein HOV94_06115 [Saccharothrix sp.]|nr:hypothetical protein [Saccharothrix sp.]
MSSRNTFSGTASGNVIQAGVVEGDVSFVTYARNDEIGVVLKHEQKEVHLKVGTETWFYVTVIDRSHRARQLDFRVESAATGLKWKIVADGAAVTAASLPAGGQVQVRLVVRCESTAPMAGADELKVLVGDAEVDVEVRDWWFSNPKPVVVEAAPALSAELVQPQGRVSSSGVYETFLELANAGNTDLHGELAIATDFDAAERSSWLKSRNFGFVDKPSFGIGLGDPPSRRRVKVDLPAPGWFDRTWKIPLSVTVSRDDVQPELRCLTIEQSGLLSRLVSWGETEETCRRRTLAAWAAVPLVLGVALGTMIGGSSGDAGSPPVQAGAALSSSPPTSESVAPVEYSEMPCEPGKSVLVLHSLEDSDGPAGIRTRLDYETMMIGQRRKGVDALTDKVAKVSKRDATCPAVLLGESPDKNTDKKFTAFVWIGPFPSNEAPAMCEVLHKITWTNCSPVHVK